MTDAENIKTYDVADNGVLLHSTYETNDARRIMVLEADAVALSRQLPGAAMFDEASLEKSFVPGRYKTAPKP